MVPPLLRKILKRTGITLLVVLAFVVALLSSFWLYAAVHQTKDRHDAAPASGRFVRGGDVEIFLQERGPIDAPAVVLIHGTGAWSGLWVPTLDALAARGYHAMALDIPPFGFSERPKDGSYATPDQARRIVGVLSSLDLRNVTLVGHSFGARATVEAALLAPERVTRLVLVDAALDLDRANQTEAPALHAVLAVTPLRNALAAATLENPLMTRTLLKALIANKSAATDERVAILQRPLVTRGLLSDAGLWLRAFSAPEAPNLSNDVSSYARIHEPVLLVWGASDTITPLAAGYRLAALLPGSNMTVLPGVGHIPQIEDPAAFDAAVLGFLGAAGP